MYEAPLVSSSFTWASSRMDRNTITVMSGQIVDFFDNDFRELYAVSEQVDLHREFNITKPVLPAALRKPKVEQILPLPISTSRFQVSVDSKQTDLKVPAHKFHNPKYSLVFGNSLGLTRSLQDLSTQKNSLVSELIQRSDLKKDLVYTEKELVEPAQTQAPSSPSNENSDAKRGLMKNQTVSVKRPLHSFRYFLKGRGANHGAETTEEGPVTMESSDSACKVPDSSSVEGHELEDSFEIVEKSALFKSKVRKPSKLPQRSMSMQTINTGDEDGMWSDILFVGPVQMV